ncbi:hypothetical protein RHMOL_Rhmol11G0065600 [Rhododendron molle]|uniref:Uncharacterized protein n=1 Tax=Rhododendron molle TaxID=49168 RepID=A0ACC0LPG3_RHOML|nr:hypothetical protein RHMOL_Rhmol11G0065600 [Rhododendron molle]
MLELPIEVKLWPVIIEQRGKHVYEYIMNINELDDGLPGYHDIWNFVEKGEFPAEATKKDRIALQRLASQYIIYGRQLYGQSPCRVQKLCIHGKDARKVMEEIHEGVFGPHMNGMMLAKKVLR